jgi:hypothetical protein
MPESVEYLHPDSVSHIGHFIVHELADGWYWEVSDRSPHAPDARETGPFLHRDHALRAAHTWIEDQA